MSSKYVRYTGRAIRSNDWFHGDYVKVYIPNMNNVYFILDHRDNKYYQVDPNSISYINILKRDKDLLFKEFLMELYCDRNIILKHYQTNYGYKVTIENKNNDLIEIYEKDFISYGKDEKYIIIRVLPYGKSEFLDIGMDIIH